MTRSSRSGRPIARRSLLAAGVLTPIGVACSSDNDARPTTTTARRRPKALTASDTTIEGNPFQLGVASGDPDAQSVVLWTRLVVDPLAEDGLGGISDDGHELVWEVADDADFAALVATDTFKTEAEIAHSVHVVVEELSPDSWYHYRFRIGSFTSPVGRTRTAPTDGTDLQTMNIAFASCQERQAGFYTAYTAMAADDLDLVLHLGDYIYENPGGEGERFAPGTLAGTLASFRAQYGAYKRDAHLQAAHALCPWLLTWDDHEVENNYAALTSGTDKTDDAFAQRRQAAYQAYWEHQPLRAARPTGDALEMYRSARFGTLAEFFVLDGRQFRTDQPCEDRIIAPIPECPDIDDDSNDMLGSEQETWLLDGLAESECTWKILCNQTVMSPLRIGDVVLNLDQWDGYPQARQRLLSGIVDRDVSNVVVLTGDIHSAGAGNLTVDVDGEDRIAAHEFVGTSITSPGLSGLVPNAADVITTDTLGIDYLNVVDHGYGRCRITADAFDTDFVMVSTVDEPEATTRIDAKLTVKAGTPGMKRR